MRHHKCASVLQSTIYLQKYLRKNECEQSYPIVCLPFIKHIPCDPGKIECLLETSIFNNLMIGNKPTTLKLAALSLLVSNKLGLSIITIHISNCNCQTVTSF